MLISFVTPVFNPPPWALKELGENLISQLGDDCEWILVDDGSTSQEHHKLLQLLNRYPSVSVRWLDENLGISGATNCAIELARGDFIAFVDQDDLLSPDACSVVRNELHDQPLTDILYSDEDKIDDDGRRYGRFRKPDWSPERLRHQNYLSHLTVIRSDLVRSVGGLRSDFDGSQDFDLVLRCSEKAQRVTHVPKVLYHWRSLSTSTAATPEAKPTAHVAAVRAVQEHLDRVGLRGNAFLMENYYVGVDRSPASHPLVSIVIPSRGTTARISGCAVCLVENCVASIVELSTYENYEIIVVLDTDADDEVRNRLLTIDSRVSIVEFDGEFNFSRKINLGVVKSRGEVVIPLNDDTQVLQPEWIEQILPYLEEPDVGTVAPVLFLEDGRIQSAGHFFQDGAHHVGAGLAASDNGPFGILSFPAERSGATFAAVAIRREVYEQVGGLSEEFPRAFNDVDFCNKLAQLGFRTIVTPKAVLYHFESLTRDPKVDESEVRKLYERWRHVINAPDEYLPHFWRQCYGLE